MNPSDPRHPWQRLAVAARQVPGDTGIATPFGFSTRVVAKVFSTDYSAPSLFSRFSLRALGVACLLMLGSVATNYSALAQAFSDDDAVSSEDPVAELVEIAS